MRHLPPIILKQIMRWGVVCVCALMLLAGALFASNGSKRIAATLGVERAEAQQTKRARRSLLGILFGRRDVKKKAVRSRNTKRRARKVRRSKKRKTRARRTKQTSRKKQRKTVAKTAKPAAVQKVGKAEDAKKVLVIGDFFAGSMADGLEEAYAGVAEIVVVDRSNGLSGFVRQDVVNWPEKLKELVTAEKPDHIVAMLGSNDRQQIVENGKKLKKRTAAWDVAYKARVQEFGEALKATRIAYTWMGLPPVRFKNMNRDFLVFNSLYSEAAQSSRGRFIDVWDGFSDADGNYSRSGPDVNGQIVLLRPKDGINLNKAGKRRLAFYIQNDLQKQLTDSTTLISPGLAFDFQDRLPRTATYDPAKTGRTVVINLDDPKIDGDETLAGAEVKTDQGTANAFRVPVFAKPARAVTQDGRVDNFRWPPQTVQPSTPSRETAQSTTQN